MLLVAVFGVTLKLGRVSQGTRRECCRHWQRLEAESLLVLLCHNLYNDKWCTPSAYPDMSNDDSLLQAVRMEQTLPQTNASCNKGSSGRSKDVGKNPTLDVRKNSSRATPLCSIASRIRP